MVSLRMMPVSPADQHGAEGGVDAGGAGDGVAGGVDHREMRGPGIGGERVVAVERGRKGRRRAHAPPPFAAALRCEERAQRHVHEVGIAVVRRPVGESELQRLGEQVQIGRASSARARASRRRAACCSTLMSTPPPELGGGMP